MPKDGMNAQGGLRFSVVLVLFCPPPTGLCCFRSLLCKTFDSDGFCGTIPADSFARRHFVRLSRIVVGFVLFGVTFSAMFCLADSVQKPFSAIFPFSDAKSPPIESAG